MPEGLIALRLQQRLTGGAWCPAEPGYSGDSTTAVLIGAFMLQGIRWAPVHHQQSVIWNTILVALLCCNILMYLVMFFR